MKLLLLIYYAWFIRLNHAVKTYFTDLLKILMFLKIRKIVKLIDIII